MAHPWSARGAGLLTLALILFLAAGCGGGGDSPSGIDDAGFPPPDDTGVTPDTGPDPIDAGDTPCDPVDGTGCPGALTCVFIPSLDEAQCREIGDTAIDAPCEASETTCVAGAACAQVAPNPGALCYQTCRTDNPTCPGDGLCVADEGATSGYGLCLPVTRCDPADDMCPIEDVCSLFQQTPVCRPAGNVARGDSCASDNCARGSTCVFLAQTTGPLCYEACDASAPSPCQTPDSRCAPLEAGFGICVPRGAACDPVADTCGAGEVCSLRGAVLECATAGNVARGGDCSAMNCQRGSTCLDIGDGATCYEPCRAEAPCSAGMCSGNVMVEGEDLGFGVCR